MQIDTTRFGTVEIAEESVVQMPEGMIGFGQCTRYALLEEKPDAPLKWLQAVDDPSLAFVVINPADFFADYEIDLDDDQTELLDLRDPSEAAVLTTVTISQRDGTITTNLVGPIVMNSRTLRARQVVLQNEKYGTKHVIGMQFYQESGHETAQAA